MKGKKWVLKFIIFNEQFFKKICLAAINGFTEVINALVAAGADINIKDENGETALILGIIWNKIKNYFVQLVFCMNWL